MRTSEKLILLQSAFSPYRLPNNAARYSLDGAASDNTYLLNSGNVQLIADRSGNSAVNAFVSSGAASNTATAPTASIMGNQTLTADLLLADYTPGTNHTLFSKLNGNSGIEWLILTTGVSRLRIGDGAAITNFDSTVAIPATDLVRGTLQVVYTDNASMVTTWNGATVGTSVVVNKILANGAATATIGTSVAGCIFSLTIGSVYNFQPSLAAKLATSFVAPTTGETWTINTSGDLGARISGARDLVQMTAAKMPAFSVVSGYNTATFDGSNDYMKAAAFSLSQPESVYFVGSQVTWTEFDKLVDGNGVANRMILGQITSSPGLELYGGTSLKLTMA